jgi:hypothetical protein
MTSAEIESDSVCCAEQDARLIQELWHVQDITLWAVDLDNPPLKVAMNGPDRDKWLEAYVSEINALKELDTFELVDRPTDKTGLRGKPVCKIKRDSLVQIERYKIRYVTCGYDHVEGEDYFQHHVWAPTGQHATLRVLLVHAAT